MKFMAPKVLIVGSFGLDTVKNPFGNVKDVAGGSAVYASIGAGFFSKTALAGCVGHDFPKPFLQKLESRGIDLSGVQYSPKKSFRWWGEYGFDANSRTDRIELGASEDLKIEIPEKLKKSSHVFLATQSPKVQQRFLELFSKKPKIVMADTIKLYIENNRPEVLELVRQADLMMMNDSEARELFQTPSILIAAQKTLELDSRFAIIKKGEDGAVLFSKKSHFVVPGYPLEKAVDPTGCGDAFAGALLGYLANEDDFSEKTVRKGMVTASAIASFNCESFSCNRLLEITKKDIVGRVKEFKEFVRF